MLSRWLRLLLLFELFAYGLLSASLLRQAGWSLPAALLLVVTLALLLRVWPVLMLHGFARLHAQSLARKNAGSATHAAGANGQLPWVLLLREMYALLRVFLHVTLEPLLLRKDAPGAARSARPARSQPTAPAASALPMLLVHGYLCNRGGWWWLKSRLEAAGRQVATVTLEPVYGDIDGYAEQIAQRVNWLCQQTGSAQVVLVGHSMGGLASLAYLRRYGEERVAQLVTLGTPHRGSAAAVLGLGRNAMQMRPGSSWLQALHAAFAELPLQLPCVAYYSMQDDMVLPPANAVAVLAGAQIDNRQLPPMGHLEMLVSPFVLAELLRVTDNWPQETWEDANA